MVSRGQNRWSSRAILNEDELLDAIRQRYGYHQVDAHRVVFNSSLSSAMLAANSTDVLIGMHGAGAHLSADVMHAC